MRLVHLTLPGEKRDAVLDALDDLGIDYAAVEEVSGGSYEELVLFPLPNDAVEPTLDRLREIGLDDEAFTVITAAESIVSERFDALRERYDEGRPAERVAHEEIRSQAREFIPANATFALLVIVAALVATAGLLLDSPAVVVGSMVIAPLIGPAMATSIGTVLHDEELFREGLRHQLLGLGLAVVSAAAFAFLVRALFLVPPTVEITAIEQISGRLTPDLLSLVVAVGSGVAGARSLSSDISTALVGVMIAAALVPPVAAVGIGLAWWLPEVVFRSGLLVLVNGFAINFAALATLWYAGYRPVDEGSVDRALGVTRQRMAVLLVGLVALSVVLGAFTFTAYQSSVRKQSIEGEVTDVLGEPRYDGLRLIDVRVEEGGGTFDPRTSLVEVTVARRSDAPYPRLADRIDRRLGDRIAGDAAVRVRFVDVETTR